MKSIVILTGPVGAGKSTVTKELVAISSGNVVCIEGDQFWFFIAKSSRSVGRQKQFRVVMASMMAAAIPFAAAGYEVIVDFSIPPWFMETAEKIVARREIPLDFVVLRPSMTVCESRAAQRAAGRIEDYSPYRDLYMDFDAVPDFTIASDTAGPTEIASEIRSRLDSGEFRWVISTVQP